MKSTQLRILNFSITILITFLSATLSIGQAWYDSFKSINTLSFQTKVQFLDSIEASGTIKDSQDSLKWRLLFLKSFSKDYQFEKFDSLLIIVDQSSDILKSDCILNSTYSGTIANTFFRRRKLEKAKEYYLKIYDCQDTVNTKWVNNFININLNLGILDQRLDNTKEGLDRLFNIEDLVMQNGTSDQKFIYYQNIALIFDDLLDYEKGLKYLNLALNVEGISKESKMTGYYNKMNIYDVAHMPDSATAMIHILLKNLNSMNRNQKFNVLGAYTGQLTRRNKLDSANFYLNQLEEHYKKNKLFHKAVPLYTKKGALDFKRGKLKSAIKNYDIALAENKKNKSPIDEQYRDLFQHRLKAILTLKTDTKTVNDHVMLSKMNDKLHQRVIEEEAHKSETKFESEKKEIQNKLLQKGGDYKLWANAPSDFNLN